MEERLVSLLIPEKLYLDLVSVANRKSPTNNGDVNKLIMDVLKTYWKFNFEIKSNEDPTVLSWKNIFISSPIDSINNFAEWYFLGNRKRKWALAYYNHEMKRFYTPNIDYNRLKMKPDFKPIFYLPLRPSPFIPVKRSPGYNLVRKIYFKHNYTCQSCKDSVFKNPNIILHIDHIFPYSKGGYHEEDNLQLLCEKCNSLKCDNIDVKQI